MILITTTPSIRPFFEQPGETLIQSSSLSAALLEIESQGLINVIDSFLDADSYMRFRADGGLTLSDESMLSGPRIELASNGDLTVNDSEVTAGTDGVELSARRDIEIAAGSEISGDTIRITGDNTDTNESTERFTILGRQTSLPQRTASIFQTPA